MRLHKIVDNDYYYSNGYSGITHLYTYSTVIVTDLTCKHCEKYVGINKKSLSVHYRNCVKTKINNNTDNESSDNTESPNIETPIVEPPKIVTNNKKKK
jgi:hypothetical protein